MKDTDFAEAIGTLRVLEKRILTTGQLERVIDANTASEALKALTQNSSYDFSSIKRNEDYEEILKAQLKETYRLLYHISPQRELVDILSAKYDYHNIKVALKDKYMKKESDHLFMEVSAIPAEAIKNAVLSGETKELPEHIAAAIKQGQQAYEAATDPQGLDVAVDKAMFAHMRTLAESVGNEYISYYVGCLIDFYNLKTLIRVKNMQKGLRFLSDTLVEGGHTEQSLFVENYDKSMDNIAGNVFYKYFGDMVRKAVEAFEKTNNFSALEKMTDDFVMEQVKKSKYIAFGPEPLFAYLLAKENEIKQVRILMTCKINEIGTATLRERLRDNYAG